MLPPPVSGSILNPLHRHQGRHRERRIHPGRRQPVLPSLHPAILIHAGLRRRGPLPKPDNLSISTKLDIDRDPLILPGRLHPADALPPNQQRNPNPFVPLVRHRASHRRLRNLHSVRPVSSLPTDSPGLRTLQPRRNPLRRTSLELRLEHHRPRCHRPPSATRLRRPIAR